METPESNIGTTTFNMNIATLERIDKILTDMSIYSVNQNWQGLKNNLLELYKESYGLLVEKKQDTDADKAWEAIKELECYFDERGNLIFDENLPKQLTDFDFWLRNLLYKYGVTFAKGDDPSKAFR